METVSEVLDAMESGRWSLEQLRFDVAPTPELEGALEVVALHVWERQVNRIAKGAFTLHCTSSPAEGGYAGYIRNDEEFNWVETPNLSRFTLDEARECRDYIIQHVDADAVIVIALVK